jgi:hypothetical protein
MRNFAATHRNKKENFELCICNTTRIQVNKDSIHVIFELLKSEKGCLSGKDTKAHD